MQWDVFCRVIDNFGDVGVCWRLAADLGARGETVRLWLDDASALAWMAPAGAPNVRVHAWPAEGAIEAVPGEVVVEAFGCELPAGFVTAMAARPPVWINLEYLSAEAYVERSHRLPSPQLSGPGRGLTKWFYYPGFTPATGGLLREPGLAGLQQRFDATEWLRLRGVVRRPGERVVSLFCYANPALAVLPEALSDTPTLLLLTAGAPEPGALPPGVRSHRLPYLTQPDYDRLLWACDLNFVRGEDSFVRAQWAARPFVWQIYPQSDDAHALKLAAFLDRFLAAAPPAEAAALRHCWAGWNGLGPLPQRLPAAGWWQAHCHGWRERLQESPDLVTGLLEFVSKSR